MTKHIFFKTLVPALLLMASTSLFASSNTTDETKAFDCVNKETFAIDSECMNSSIEDNLVFKSAQKAVVENAETASDRAMASMTFDSTTMTIKIVAHKDATLAKADTKNTPSNTK